jgi:hypothetical protein
MIIVAAANSARHLAATEEQKSKICYHQHREFDRSLHISSRSPDTSRRVPTAVNIESGGIRVCLATNAQIALRRSSVRSRSAPPKVTICVDLKRTLNSSATLGQHSPASPCRAPLPPSTVSRRREILWLGLRYLALVFATQLPLFRKIKVPERRVVTARSVLPWRLKSPTPNERGSPTAP